jgi:methylamine dehydrogenase accessory protein MauD
MNIFWSVSIVILWIIVLFLGFLLIGTLRALGVLSWRLDNLESTSPRRIGRDGVKCGKKAPDFTLPSVEGDAVSLHDFYGRKLMLVFTQSGCSQCKAIVPELNRLADGEMQVIVVNNADLETTRKWCAEVGARFPVLAQEKMSVSKRYEVFATPFAFMVDENGIVASKGIIKNRQHIRYVMSGTAVAEPDGHDAAEPADSAEGESPGTSSLSPSEEINHV